MRLPHSSMRHRLCLHPVTTPSTHPLSSLPHFCDCTPFLFSLTRTCLCAAVYVCTRSFRCACACAAVVCVCALICCCCIVIVSIKHQITIYITYLLSVHC